MNAAGDMLAGKEIQDDYGYIADANANVDQTIASVGSAVDTAKQIHKREVRAELGRGMVETGAAFVQGDHEAANAVGTGASALGTGGVLAKIGRGSGNGKGGSEHTLVRESADSINPELQKRSEAFRAYKERQGLEKSDNVSRQQFENFRRGNAGKNGWQLYDKRTNYQDPQVTQHGNKLDQRPADIYMRRDMDNNDLKIGISQDASTRYPVYEDIELGRRTDQLGTRPRVKAEKIERWLDERHDYPESNTKWSGKRDPNSPNYDPTYVPKHLRKKDD